MKLHHEHCGLKALIWQSCTLQSNTSQSSSHRIWCLVFKFMTRSVFGKQGEELKMVGAISTLHGSRRAAEYWCVAEESPQQHPQGINLDESSSIKSGSSVTVLICVFINNRKEQWLGLCSPPHTYGIPSLSKSGLPYRDHLYIIIDHFHVFSHNLPPSTL